MLSALHAFIVFISEQTLIWLNLWIFFCSKKRVTINAPYRAAEYIFVPGTTNFGDLSCPLKNNQIIPIFPYEWAQIHTQQISLLGFCAHWSWFVPCTVRISLWAQRRIIKKVQSGDLWSLESVRARDRRSQRSRSSASLHLGYVNNNVKKIHNTVIHFFLLRHMLYKRGRQ